jgi:glycosyltransferase involved in cell wall biosynthesis
LKVWLLSKQRPNSKVPQIDSFSRRSPRICIIAHNSFGALSGGHTGHVGGSERQTALMARWFAARGYETSCITWNEGQPDGEPIRGVRVWKTCGPDEGIPGIRFFVPRLSSLYSAMRRADADIYYHNSAQYVTGLAAAWCRRNGRRFVYSAAAELACDARLPLMKKPHERFLYRRGVRQAHLRIVQTERQQELLRNGWGLESMVLPMPCPGRSANEFRAPSPPNPARVVWVGRVDPNKRPDWLLAIAEKLPAIQFDIAAAPNGYFDVPNRLQRQAENMPNVRWCGAVSWEKMPEFYPGATCLCCTSMHEGFPNIFLEAWSHGVPVVTTFDPGGIIKRLNLGTQAADVESLASAIAKLAEAKDLWRTQSRNARRYYEENHEVDSAMERFEAALVGLVRSPVSNPRAVPASADFQVP